MKEKFTNFFVDQLNTRPFITGFVTVAAGLVLLTGCCGCTLILWALGSGGG